MKGITDEEVKQLVLSVGTHRGERSLAPQEVAGLLQMALKSGTTRAELASTFGLGSTQVAEFLRLLRVIPQVRDLAGWGRTSGSKIAFSSLAQLARLAPRDQMPAATAILKYSLSWKEVVQLVQMTDRSVDSIDASVERLLRLRPVIERRHVLIGSVHGRQLQSRLAGLSQRQRDRVMQQILQPILGSAAGWDCRLGTTMFSLSAPFDVEQVIEMSPDALERWVEAQLSTEVGLELSD